MKCDFCDQKATVFLTQLVEGQMKKVCLCDPCAKARGVTDPTGFSLADLLLGGAPAGPGPGAGGKPSPATATAGGGRKCPTCGFTLDDLRRVRRFGCSDCYATFSDEVGQIIRGMHQGTSHVGKVPAGLMALHIRHQRIEELRSRLDQAITSESYEEAAGIRDEIRNLGDGQST
ncbi:MAG: UvrB/UvrC motif-containing protein [Verrucomicrobiota bacterium]